MVVYLLTPKKYRNGVLLLGSLLFYGIGEPHFIWILMGSVAINYVLSLRIVRKKSRVALITTLVFDFLILFLFKYWDFGAENINRLVQQEFLPLLHLALPLGISFYTFQMASFQIDCYKGKIEQGFSFVDFATYICMFPQLVAGPIVKYQEIAPELKNRECTIKNVEQGFQLFTVGLGLKVLLANPMGTLWNAIQTAGTVGLSGRVAWLGAFAYSFQIYFDFWGYSVMAAGLGKMIGFRIPANFQNPYISKSMSEFWRRWHITLGRWFKEYVYIPLGGNRRGNKRTIFNLFVVWTLTGLWHGASWNFVLWGFSFFLLLAIEKIFLGSILEKHSLLGHLYVILVIPVTWVVFGITDFKILVQYLSSMFGMNGSNVLVGQEQFIRYLGTYGALLGFCVLFSTPIPMRIYKRFSEHFFMKIILVVVLGFSVYEMLQGSNNPFLYFRF
ncbi:MAG: MBOAT family protein [bacterium]|nr:MBOAT family protein [bacterium]